MPVITMTSLEAKYKFGAVMDTSQRELRYQFTKLMSELFSLQGAVAVAELNRLLAPVRAKTAANGLTKNKLRVILNEA